MSLFTCLLIFMFQNVIPHRIVLHNPLHRHSILSMVLLQILQQCWSIDGHSLCTDFVIFKI